LNARKAIICLKKSNIFFIQLAIGGKLYVSQKRMHCFMTNDTCSNVYNMRPSWLDPANRESRKSGNYLDNLNNEHRIKNVEFRAYFIRYSMFIIRHTYFDLLRLARHLLKVDVH
jgi:hypothetical protein